MAPAATFSPVAKALAPFQGAGQEGPHYLVYLAPHAQNGLNSLLQKQLLGPITHAAGDNVGHTQATKITGQEARFVPRVGDDCLAGDRVTINVENSVLRTVAEMLTHIITFTSNGYLRQSPFTLLTFVTSLTSAPAMAKGAGAAGTALVRA